MQIPAVSAHAIKRYMERTSCKSPERARTRIEYCFINGKKLKVSKADKSGAIKLYAAGFVVCINDGIIVTIYRPTTASIKRKIHALSKQKSPITRCREKTK